MPEYSRDEMWGLIKKFVRESMKNYDGFVASYGTFYLGTKVLGSYKPYKNYKTTWLCFTYGDETISNGIYISLFVNRTRNGLRFDLDNVEMCYAESERNVPELHWEKNLPNSTSESYPKSLCAETYDPKDILNDRCKESLLSRLDKMIAEYKGYLDGTEEKKSDEDEEYGGGAIHSDKSDSQTSLDWVEQKMGKKLTAQQRAVAALDYEHEDIDAALVVASAGCGKSTSLMGHVLHLIADGKVRHSDDVLMVVFNNKNRKDLRRKAKEYGFANLGASIHTFHSLGLGIVRKQDSNISSIDPNSEETKPLAVVLARYLKEKKGGDEWIKDLWRFGTDIKQEKRQKGVYEREIQDDSMRDMIYDLEKADFSFMPGAQAVRNDLIKIRLQNFLTLYGVDAIWAKNDNKEETKRCKINDTSYAILWGQKPNIRRNSEYFVGELDDELDARGFARLKEKLMSWECKLNRIDNNKLKELLLDAVLRARGEKFRRVAELFITLFKIHYPDPKCAVDCLESIRGDLLKKHGGDQLKENHINAFFDLLKPVYVDYQQELKDNGQIDFNDMLNQAIKYIRDGKVANKCKYILVDEFQDVAQDNFQLIKALQEQTGAKVMCVGDDWQSIYSWRGSDLEYFENFEKYFPRSKELYITETFRNGQNLVDVAAKFVRKDKSLKDKKPISNQSETELIPVYYNAWERTEKWREMTDEIGGQDVLFLMRYYADENLAPDGYKFNHRNMVIHKAKGLETDVVVIMNMKNIGLGFPSAVESDVVFDTLCKERAQQALNEERRLFYVALTRARKKCYLWIPKWNKSVFAEEIGF